MSLNELIKKYKKDIENFESNYNKKLKEIEKNGYLVMSEYVGSNVDDAYDIGIEFGEYYEKCSILQHLIDLKGELK